MALTDLEGATLAAIASRGAATGYVIARFFADSPSEFWSGSAGAVYPAIKRLAARGYLEATPGATGRRAQITYRLTEDGRMAMEAWLLDAKQAAGLGFDPLRTRLTYLHVVPAQRRARFLAQVRAEFAAVAAKPAFDGQPMLQKIHATWLNARAAWLKTLNFIEGDS
jgi:DNA-binding PadR family transcriptional regulator